MSELTAAMLDARWPRAAHSIVDGIIAAIPDVFPKFEINTPLREVHLLAQISEETDAGTQLEENLHYSAERLREVWPSRFPTLAAAAPYAHNPRLLADKVYGGRMGNRPGTEDGWTYHGAGLIQLTGRDEFEAVGKIAGLDLIAEPGLACAPKTALLIACAYWHMIGANAYADRDDIVDETWRVNGGLTNLAARRAWLAVWKREFKI